MFPIRNDKIYIIYHIIYLYSYHYIHIYAFVKYYFDILTKYSYNLLIAISLGINNTTILLNLLTPYNQYPILVIDTIIPYFCDNSDSKVSRI